MSSTIATVRPVAIGVTNRPGWTISPSGTLFGVLSDDTDTTFLTPPAGNTESIELSLNMAPFTLPALAQIQWIRVRARLKSATTSTGTAAYIETMGALKGWPEWNDGRLAGTTANVITTLSGPQWTAKTEDAKGAYTTADLANLAIALWPARSNDLTLYELYLDVGYNQAPTVVVTDPNGTITNSSTPALIHTFSDPENDIQDRYRRKIFAMPGGSWPSDFDPERGTGTGITKQAPIYDSGTIFSVNSQDYAPYPLQSGVHRLHNGTYRHYAKAADQGSRGRFSLWAFSDFTINNTPPTAPTLTVQGQINLARVALTMTPGVGGTTTTTSFHLQRSDDGQQTWADVRGVGNPTITTGGSPVTVYDRDAPREKIIWYRARATGQISGEDLTCPYIAPAQSRLGSDNSSWLHSSGDPTLDMQVIVEGPDFAGITREDQAIYWPEGRATAVVYGGTVHTENFSKGIVFAFTNDAVWQQFTAIRNRQEPVLLRTLYGDAVNGLEQFWIRLGADLETTRLGGSYVLDKVAQIRKVTVQAVVVARPA